MTCRSLKPIALAIFAFYETLVQGNHVELPLAQQQRLQNGEQEFQKIRSRADHNKCWEEAISRLRDGCKHLSDVEQSRLAIAFANCHFEKSGLKKYPCGESDSIEECTKDMTESVLAFNTYTEFYTHTSDICFYLQSKIWQQKTEDTINKLSSTSHMVADQLETSLINQKQVLEGQKSSLSNQGEILQNEAYLKNALKTSAESAKEAFLDMKKATAQQKAVLMETFDSLFKGVERITKLQSMLLGEFMTLHSLGFYLVSVLACYIITSAPRTAAARLWLFGILSAHIVIERLIVRWNITDKESQQSGTTTVFKDFLYIQNYILYIDIVCHTLLFLSEGLEGGCNLGRGVGTIGYQQKPKTEASSYVGGSLGMLPLEKCSFAKLF